MAIGLAAAAPESCNKYHTRTDLGDFCVKIENRTNDYLVQSCKAPQVCRMNDSEYPKKCGTADPKELMPNEICSEDEDCHSKNCTKSRCIGKKVNEACEDIKDCDPGNICHKENATATEKGKCLEAKKIGGDCSSYLDCVVPLQCANNKCVEVESQPENVTVGEGNELACKSYYIEMNEGNESVCAKAPKLANQSKLLTEPKSCTSNDGCKYDNQKINESCICGRTEEGDKYCKVYPGDFDHEDIGNVSFLPNDYDL